VLADAAWQYAIDSPLPPRLRAGAGSAIFVSGWLFHRHAPVRAVTLRLGDALHPVRMHSMPRLDVYVARAEPGDRPLTTAYRCGFWAVVPVPGVAAPADAAVVLEAENEDGGRFAEELGTIRVLPAVTTSPAETEPGLIAVCMTTFEPAVALFRRQVASIRSQSHERWRCIVVDDGSDPAAYAEIRAVLAGDERFELHRNDERLGFYFNFERALSLVPPEAEAVALCDQDDEWRPAKLETLLAALREGHRLVYSDQRIVTPAGDVLASTFWAERENQWTDLGALLVSNTVTGAASLFRRDLLDVALPFPPRLASAYHDHWLALAARATGTIGYVDEPLYDYVQHGTQVLGHPAGDGEQVQPPAPRPAREQRWQFGYFAHVVPAQFAATALLERCGSQLRPDERDTLESFVEGDATLRGVLAHARTTSALRPRAEGDRFAALAGMAWRRWSRFRTRRDVRPFGDGRHNLDARPSYAEYGPEPAEDADQYGSAPGRGRRRWRIR
jgi:hypothetical protein